ncbi:UDP-N-acetylmuramoyl-L-alanine--D-glutamate ligase [Thalassotalea sp. 1_MG-2023]|uniref:UDP-N-acetylmuramoyl-L-alanine--D-glutamate ligase n=1 Tax=Thalassotalea sp. 1_MG-2023 TaxID=3062680 RepID=UPI0026E28A58|nr:UDP-N-acetylmuramoyl-L-alanine--D-glutamate ligase [Thalassotalea sp. 1_MG-2023]MDO6427180.1 UDP-N-acetylmuramoyl-L-alanine--D-glutamate ligase [Thalassotalea sp. 1_MG-2023]
MNLNVVNNYKNKRIVVLGAGLTGMSCVRFLQQHNISCLINDSRNNIINDNEFSRAYPKNTLVTGFWDLDEISQADILLVSPGIDLHAEDLFPHISMGCKVIGDVELFCQLNDKPIVAVTGSNGKSTVVSILSHIASALEVNMALAGNVGTPVLELINAEVDGFIFELSSFQIETLQSMQAKVATVLNISDDHLDRHLTVENYSEIKQKVYQQCEFAVINRDDPASYNHLTLTAERVTSFGLGVPSQSDFGIITEGECQYLAFGKQKIIDINTLPLAGLHNALNYLAIFAIAHRLGWPLDAVANACKSFHGLEHRCQRIITSDNINWINDSKATNVGATVAAIEGLYPTLTSGEIILIAGGEGKGANFSMLEDAITNKVAKLITYGKDGHQIAQLKSSSLQVESLEQAVKQASVCAKAGDIVLLSPACASLDMFKNFAERGDVFAQTVKSLQGAE